GKLIPLAVTTEFRAPEMPDVPTMSEAGVPGFDISTWYAFFAPANMDKATLEKLNAALVKAIKSDSMKVRFDQMGAVEKAGTPEQLDEFVKSELAKYKKIVDASGAKVD
ncbi:MAG: tripartite tricarboxylate transporter substrate binding protein, partial [Burkholderiales bacterium]|nr:tripartite tricarboxylate transporter substrate binding protein [Burkholderiales bacterium]